MMRDPIVIGFKAFDVHELLPHFVARELGMYLAAGLRVGLKDVTFQPDEQFDPPFTAACGWALMSRLKGARRKVVFVTTDRPMFWMHARHDIREMCDLKGQRIATYPAGSPPYHFHRAILLKAGLDPDRDVQLELARDDVARFGLLRSGEVAAAVLSSAIPPAKVQALGFFTVSFFGDEIRIPTTGLAANEEMIIKDPELVRALVKVFQQSMTAIHTEPEKIIPVIAGLLGESREFAEKTYELVRGCFTRAGRASADAEHNAIEMVNRQLPPGQKLRVEDVYDHSFLT
jgi:ABC-type nitrate/sulfonate/bicarbonate transport system substrate-binding protein